MSKLSYKTLFIIFFFLLIGVIVLSKFALPNQKVSAAWWNDGWGYRQYFPINNTSGADQSNFTVSINIDTSTLITAGKMQPTCNDIRATDINGNVLKHFVTQCNTTSTNIYVQLPVTPSSGTGIYLYYGNSSTPNIETTSIFTYFEGFETGTTQATWTTSQLSVGVTNIFNKGNYVLKFTAQGPNWDSLFQTFPTSNNWADNYLEYEFYSDIAGSTPIWYIDPRDSSNNRINAWKTTSIIGGSWVTFSQDLNTNTYKNDIKSIQYFTGNDNDNRVIFIDSFRIRHCTSTVSSGTPSTEETGTAPIAYWKFDEGIGTTAYDSTSNRNNGIISNATWVSEDQCISGKCLYFNGVNSNNKVDLGTSIKLNPSNFSISAWIKADNASSSYGYIFSNDRDCCGTYNGFSLFIQGGKLIGDIWNSTVTTIVSNRNISSNQWTHVNFTYDGSSIKLYINGILDNSVNYNGGVGSPASFNFSIGTMGLSQGYYTFKGFIDEAKIYSYARTAAQIKLDYNSRGSSKGSSANLGVKSNTTPSLSSKLVAYYKFDEGSGTKINNSVNGGIGLSGVFGTGNSAPTWTNDGKFGKALSFTAPQNAKINTAAALNYTQNGFTYSAWIYPNILNPTYNMFMGQWLPYFDINTNRLHMSMGAAGAQRAVSGNTTNITTGKWYYVAATYDSQGYMKVYLNGKLDGTAGPYLIPINYGNNLYFGTWESDGSYPFNGLIDEVKIYNYALTSDEIKLDYNQGSSTTFGTSSQTIGNTTTSLDYCIPGDTTYCASPIAEYKMDEKTGTIIKDTSGNNNTGTFGTGNSAPTWTTGKIGAGLNFDGNDYINNGVNQSYTSNLTINSWIKTNSSSIGTIVSKYGNNNYWTYRVYTDSNGKVNFERGDNVVAWRTTLISNISVNDNNWHFVSVNYDSTNMNIYIDGKLDNSTPENRTADGTNYYNFCIGNDHHYCSPAGTKGFFNGTLDHIKIYNYARTPAQIAYDYNRGEPVGWWKLDECQGNIAKDSSGIGNTGIINIGASGTQNSLGTCQVGTSAAWTTGATGKFNSSLNFDGVDDKVSIGNPTTLRVTSGDFTVASWLKLSESKCATEAIDKGKNLLCGSFYYGGWTLGASGTNLGFILSDSANVRAQFLSFSAQLNNWYHLVGIKKGNTAYLYVDGKLRSSADITGYVIDDDANLTIGGNVYWRWAGQIDDVRLYNYALTSEQIKILYNGGGVNFN